MGGNYLYFALQCKSYTLHSNYEMCLCMYFGVGKFGATAVGRCVWVRVRNRVLLPQVCLEQGGSAQYVRAIYKCQLNRECSFCALL